MTVEILRVIEARLQAPASRAIRVGKRQSVFYKKLLSIRTLKQTLFDVIKLED